MGQLLRVFELWSPGPKSGMEVRVKKITHIKHLASCLAYSRDSAKASHPPFPCLFVVNYLVIVRSTKFFNSLGSVILNQCFCFHYEVMNYRQLLGCHRRGTWTRDTIQIIAVEVLVPSVGRPGKKPRQWCPNRTLEGQMGYIRQKLKARECPLQTQIQQFEPICFLSSSEVFLKGSGVGSQQDKGNSWGKREQRVPKIGIWFPLRACQSSVILRKLLNLSKLVSSS